MDGEGEAAGVIVLVTGVPGVGKTTLIRRVAQILAGDGLKLAGFYTEEMRRSGGRVGFKIVSFSGDESVLARTGPRAHEAGHQVGRYAVDVEALERVAVPALAVDPGVDLHVIDEIGKM